MANQSSSTALSALTRVGTSLGTRALGSLAGLSGSTVGVAGLMASPLIYGLSRMLSGDWPNNNPLGPEHPFVYMTPDAQGNAYWQNDRSKNPVALVEVPGSAARTEDPKTGNKLPGGASQKLYFLPGVNPAEIGAEYGQDWSSIPKTPTQDSTGNRAGEWKTYSTGPVSGREGNMVEGQNQTTVFVPLGGQAEPSPAQMSLNQFSNGQENTAIRGATVLPAGYYMANYGGGANTGGGTATTGTGTTTGTATGASGGGAGGLAALGGLFQNDSQARAWILENLGWDALQNYVQGQNTPAGTVQGGAVPQYAGNGGTTATGQETPSGVSTMNTTASATAMNRTGWEHYRELYGVYPGGANMAPPAWAPGEQEGYRPGTNPNSPYSANYSPTISGGPEPVYQGQGGTYGSALPPGISQSDPEYAQVWGPGGVPISPAQQAANNSPTTPWWQTLGIPQDVALRMMGGWQDTGTGDYWSSSPSLTPASGTATGGTSADTSSLYTRRNRQRRSTLLTGGQGLLGGAPTYRPSLLG